MSSYYKDGLDRGMRGKGTPLGPMESIFVNDKQEAEARRGLEAGLSARAHAEALKEAIEELEEAREDSDTSSSSDYYNSSTDYVSGSSSKADSASGFSSILNIFLKIWCGAIGLGGALGFIIGAIHGAQVGGVFVAIIYAIAGIPLGALMGLVWPLFLFVIISNIIHNI